MADRPGPEATGRDIPATETAGTEGPAGADGASWKGHAALILVICFFCGVFPLLGERFAVLDFNSLMGHFGIIGQKAAGGANFMGRGGDAVRHGFLFGLSVIPAVMFALGVVSAADSYGALRAAQKLLSPLMRPLLGLPGGATLALISSTQSSDAGGALTRRIFDDGIISERERSIFSAFQFSAASCVTVYLSSAPAFSQGLTIPFLAPVGILLAFKVFGANLMRLWLHFFPGPGDDFRAGGPVPGVGSHAKGAGGDAQASAGTAAVRMAPAGPDAGGPLPGRPSASGAASAPKGPYAACVDGMRRGWQLGVTSLLPNIMLAFALIAVLKETGLLVLLGDLFRPAMSIFGLPGEAVTVLAASWLSAVGGAGIAASLYAQGAFTPQELTILVPGLYLIGAQLQYMGRILSVAGTSPRVYPVLYLISLINSALAMLVMRFLVV